MCLCVCAQSNACLPEKKLWKGLLGASGRLSLAAVAASLAACLGSSGMAAFTEEAASCAASWGLLPPALAGFSIFSKYTARLGSTNLSEPGYLLCSVMAEEGALRCSQDETVQSLVS